MSSCIHDARKCVLTHMMQIVIKKTLMLTKHLSHVPDLYPADSPPKQEIAAVKDVTVYDPFTVEPLPAQYRLPFADINYRLLKRGKGWLAFLLVRELYFTRSGRGVFFLFFFFWSVCVCVWGGGGGGGVK